MASLHTPHPHWEPTGTGSWQACIALVCVEEAIWRAAEVWINRLQMFGYTEMENMRLLCWQRGSPAASAVTSFRAPRSRNKSFPIDSATPSMQRVYLPFPIQWGWVIGKKIKVYSRDVYLLIMTKPVITFSGAWPVPRQTYGYLPSQRELPVLMIGGWDDLIVVAHQHGYMQKQWSMCFINYEWTFATIKDQLFTLTLGR